jgi:hypothetical protein
MQAITKKLIDAGYRGKVFSYIDVPGLRKTGRRKSGKNNHLSNAVKLGEIIMLMRGIYIIAPRLTDAARSTEDVHLSSSGYIAKCLAPRKSGWKPWYPGCYIKSYTTCVTALSLHGWIPESVHVTISACEYVPGSYHHTNIKKLSNYYGEFRYHTPILNNNIEFWDDAIPVYNITNEGEPYYYVATPLRAIADMVYINRIKFSDATMLQAFEYRCPLSYLTDSMRIELSNLESITSEDFDRTISVYKSKTVLKFLKELREQLKK